MRSLSNEKQVTKDTPPTFIFQTNEDTAVPAENSVYFYLALRKAGVPAELHIFRTGRHGLGLAANTPGTSEWPKCCENWLRSQGFLERGGKKTTNRRCMQERMATAQRTCPKTCWTELQGDGKGRSFGTPRNPCSDFEGIQSPYRGGGGKRAYKACRCRQARIASRATGTHAQLTNDELIRMQWDDPIKTQRKQKKAYV